MGFLGEGLDAVGWASLVYQVFELWTWSLYFPRLFGVSLG